MCKSVFHLKIRTSKVNHWTMSYMFQTIIFQKKMQKKKTKTSRCNIDTETELPNWIPMNPCETIQI